MTLQNNFFGQFSKHNKLGNHEIIMIMMNEYLVDLVYFLKRVAREKLLEILISNYESFLDKVNMSSA